MYCSYDGPAVAVSHDVWYESVIEIDVVASNDDVVIHRHDHYCFDTGMDHSHHTMTMVAGGDGEKESMLLLLLFVDDTISPLRHHYLRLPHHPRAIVYSVEEIPSQRIDSIQPCSWIVHSQWH
jgi:glycerophosphoryl diester phosphodiesterase